MWQTNGKMHSKFGFHYNLKSNNESEEKESCSLLVWDRKAKEYV